MTSNSSDTQFLARIARYTTHKIQVQITFVSVVFFAAGAIVQRSIQNPTSAIPLVIVLLAAIGFGSMWTNYITGPLARTVLQQQETIAQLQRDLAARRERQS